MVLMRLTWFVLLLLIFINGCEAQQTYNDNRQLDCENNFTTALGYTCNGASSSCFSYVTFRSHPPLYNTPSSIASLLRADPNQITSLNNFSSASATIPADHIVLVPLPNCSCTTAASFYQHNATYVLRNTDETYFSVSNSTYQGLTTCQAMISQNPYNNRQLAVGRNLTVPVRCACPTANQTASGIRYLLTYLITWGDSIDFIAQTFGDVDAQSILDANELSPTHAIFPFTPLLVPLTTEPTRIKNSASPTPPPSSPHIPLVPAVVGKNR